MLKRRPRGLGVAGGWVPPLQVLFPQQTCSGHVRGPWHFSAAHWEPLPSTCPYLVQREASTPGI